MVTFILFVSRPISWFSHIFPVRMSSTRPSSDSTLNPGDFGSKWTQIRHSMKAALMGQSIQTLLMRVKTVLGIPLASDLIQDQKCQTSQNCSLILVYVLSVVDFLSEALGCISSVLLIVGVFLVRSLQMEWFMKWLIKWLPSAQDRVTLLIPWLIIVPLHTIIDTFLLLLILLVRNLSV